ncbi:1802_t:CDS:1, partial [Paraglomus occultum]
SENNNTKSVSDRGSVASAETVPSPPPRKRPRYQKPRLASIRALCREGMLERIQALGKIAAQRKRQFTYKASTPTDEQLREAYTSFSMCDNRPKQYTEAARLHELVTKSALTVRKQASVLRMGVGTWKTCKKQVARMAEVVKYCGIDLDEEIPPKTFWRVAPVKLYTVIFAYLRKCLQDRTVASIDDEFDMYKTTNSSDEEEEEKKPYFKTSGRG